MLINVVLQIKFGVNIYRGNHGNHNRYNDMYYIIFTKTMRLFYFVKKSIKSFDLTQGYSEFHDYWHLRPFYCNVCCSTH